MGIITQSSITKKIHLVHRNQIQKVLLTLSEVVRDKQSFIFLDGSTTQWGHTLTYLCFPGPTDPLFSESKQNTNYVACIQKVPFYSGITAMP